MWKSHSHAVAAWVVLLALAVDVHSETASLLDVQSISLDDAIAKTLASNPELLAFGYQLKAAQGRVQQAGLAPNPELSVAVEDALGTDGFQGINSAETTISLAWIFERGAREYRVSAAQANASLFGVDADILRVDIAAETARRFLTVLANTARAANVSEAGRLAEETVSAVQRRVNAGRTPQADLARAEAELAFAKLAQEDTEHELAIARHRLAAQWGETKPKFTMVRGDPLTLPDVEPFERVRKRVEHNPEMARYLSKERSAEAELRLAQAQRKPAWQARIGVRRFDFTDDHALVAGITIPLAVRDRNQGRIAEARAVIEQTRAGAAAAIVRIDTTLFVLYEELNHSLGRANVLRSEIVPRLESALAETRAAYDLGRYSYMEWRAVQAELIDARRELIEASIDAHRHVIEIERLTGVRVTRTGTTQ